MSVGRDPTSGRLETFRQGQLLAALIFFHIAGPAVQMIVPALVLLILYPLYILLLTSAIFAMSSSRRRLTTGVLALPMIASIIATVSAGRSEPLVFSAAALPFLAYASYVVFRGVLAPGVVDRARLLGSATVFILMGQVWAGIYSGLELIDAGSFYAADGRGFGAGELAFFSLVTQTTLGYGDITPVSPLAQALTTLQATAGLFFMGVVVARFAGRLELGEPEPGHCEAHPVVDSNATPVPPSGGLDD